MQRFRVARRALVVANGGVAAGALLFGVVSVVAGRPWGSVFASLVAAAVHGSIAFVFGRQQVVLTGDGIVATQGFRRLRVAWDDIERVHLDWAAEAAGRDREVLQIEQTSGATVSSGAPAGMGSATEGTQAAQLESTLRERGTANGFTLEVTVPSWEVRGRDGTRS